MHSYYINTKGPSRSFSAISLLVISHHCCEGKVGLKPFSNSQPYEVHSLTSWQKASLSCKLILTSWERWSWGQEQHLELYKWKNFCCFNETIEVFFFGNRSIKPALKISKCGDFWKSWKQLMLISGVAGQYVVHKAEMQWICSLPSYYPNPLVFLFHFFFGFSLPAGVLFALETFLWWGCEKHREIKELIKYSHQSCELWFVGPVVIYSYLLFLILALWVLGLSLLRDLFWHALEDGFLWTFMIVVGRRDSDYNVVKKKSYCPWLSGQQRTWLETYESLDLC